MLAATAVLAAVPAHFVLDLAPAAPPAAGSLSSSVAAAQLAARVLGAQASKSFSFPLRRERGPVLHRACRRRRPGSGEWHHRCDDGVLPRSVLQARAADVVHMGALRGLPGPNHATFPAASDLALAAEALCPGPGASLPHTLHERRHELVLRLELGLAEMGARNRLDGAARHRPRIFVYWAGVPLEGDLPRARTERLADPERFQWCVFFSAPRARLRSLCLTLHTHTHTLRARVEYIHTRLPLLPPPPSPHDVRRPRLFSLVAWSGWTPKRGGL
jgi:hypothetical protein